MLLEITSISNFLVHVARCADIISEEQLILLNNNIIQTLKCFYTNFWDINDIHLHDKYRQINIVNNAIDIKLQKAIINAHFKLEYFSSYFTKNLVIKVQPGNVDLIVAGTKYNLFNYINPPLPWTIPLEKNLSFNSIYIQSAMDKFYREQNNFYKIKLTYYNTLPFSTSNIKIKQLDLLPRYLCTW